MKHPPYAIVMFVGALALVWIVPLLGLVVTSLRPIAESASGWWTLDPLTISFEAWSTVWDKYPIWSAFITSFKLTAIATLLTMILAPAAAYAFHFLKFFGRRVLLIIIVNAFVLPQQVVIIPLFNLWRDTGMIDNIWAVIIPMVGLSFSWAIFLVKNFFDDFPSELIDAAKVDSCGPVATFFHVVLPNSITPMAAVGILQFLWTWNSLLLPMLYLRSEIPLTVLLARIAGSYEPNLDQQAVAAIITTAIPLLIFIVFQRYFSAGSKTNTGGKE